ncbi:MULTISPECIES: McrB family protein [unclassified Moraxella]|uniref:McrB family protein n=1 Tax=unclassified Moraxella TaxID=2685852 RepID=UPI003AF84970
MSNPNQIPSNIIFTGVAGTGKTYQLQQIAKQYTEVLPLATGEDLLKNLVEPLSWREVICLVFLDERRQGKQLLKVAEITAHEFFITKLKINNREKAIANTAWSTLQQFSPTDSKNVLVKNKSSQAFFDKDESSNWFLLEESLPLLQPLQAQLDDYQASIQRQNVQKIERFSLVSFHQAYGYEEFVEGIRPKINDNGQMTYSVEQGAFLKLCQQAQQNPNHRYAMLIDEINRANVSRVFGELMSLIEPSKRAGQANAMTVNLAYSGKPFSVPSNVDIYATMNTQDHSLAPLDLAFRRRFQFVECEPQPQILGQIVVDNSVIDLTNLLTILNQKICQTLGKDSQLGHSFLMGIERLDELAVAFEQSIIPQVGQACQNNGQILQVIFGRDVIEVVENSQQFGFMPMQNAFSINKKALQSINTYLAIGG